MAEVKKEKEPVLDLVCFATETPITLKDAIAHGVLVVGMTEYTPTHGDTAALHNAHVTPLAAVNGVISKDAKTIRLTLRRENPDEPFKGYAYQTVETFKGITAAPGDDAYGDTYL